MSVKFKKVFQGKIPFSRFDFVKLKGLVENISIDIVKDANRQHRFKPQSGNLERSIKYRISITPKRIISFLFLDNRIANYGKYIHNGFKSWKPDPFLFNAVENKIKTLKTFIKLKMKQLQ